MKKQSKCLAIEHLVRQIERAIFEAEMYDFKLYSIEFVKDNFYKARKLTLRGYADIDLDKKIVLKTGIDEVREKVAISRFIR